MTVLDDPYGLAAALAVNRLDAVLINYDAADGNTIIDVCEGLRSWSAIRFWLCLAAAKRR
ncbi:MAG: hypothetical protein U0528_00495 [Anaerolineae bacterium]